MKAAKACACDALYFTSSAPRPATTWRQWAIAENGQVIVIVSVIDDSKEKEILPDVESAVASFEMKR